MCVCVCFCVPEELATFIARGVWCCIHPWNMQSPVSPHKVFESCDCADVLRHPLGGFHPLLHMTDVDDADERNMLMYELQQGYRGESPAVSDDEYEG